MKTSELLDRLFFEKYDDQIKFCWNEEKEQRLKKILAIIDKVLP